MRSRAFVQSLAAAGGVVLLAVAGAYVHFTTLAGAQTRLDAVRWELARVQANNAAQRDAVRTLPQIEQRAAAFRARLPAEPDLGDVLKSLGAQLAAAQVREQEMVTRPTVSAAQCMRIPVTLRFRGPLASAFDVVQRIESQSRLTRVDKLKVERVADREQPMVEIEFSSFTSTTEAGAPWPVK